MTSRRQSEQSAGCNGWPNYETWTVALWLDNEKASYHHWRGLVRQVRAAVPCSSLVQERRFSESEAAEMLLADLLRESVDALFPDVVVGMYADLLRAALSEVDWLAIAKNLLAEDL